VLIVQVLMQLAVLGVELVVFLTVLAVQMLVLATVLLSGSIRMSAMPRLVLRVELIVSFCMLVVQFFVTGAMLGAELAMDFPMLVVRIRRRRTDHESDDRHHGQRECPSFHGRTLLAP
jgi:hypothetical protein